MSDRTQAGARFYGVPVELRQQARDILENGGFAASYDEEYENPFEDTVFDPEVRLTAMRSIADELDRLMGESGVDFAYYLTEEPYTPYLGSVHAYVPQVGRFDSDEADGEGNVVLGWERIKGVLDISTDLADAAERFAKLTGGPVLDVIGQLWLLENDARRKGEDPIYPWQQG